MPQTSVILDVVIGAVMAIFLLIGMKKGFFRTLADLVLVFIAAFGANLAAKSLAGPAAKLLAPMLEQQVLTRLEAAMGDLAGLAEGVVTAASEELVHTISFGILFLLAFLVLVIVLKILVGVAVARAVFAMMAAAPISIASQACEGLPMPASTIMGRSISSMRI